MCYFIKTNTFFKFKSIFTTVHERQDIKRAIFLLWKNLGESLHVSRKNKIVFSKQNCFSENQPVNFNFPYILIITLSSSIARKIVSFFVIFVYSGLAV